MANSINWLCSVVLLILIQGNDLRQQSFTEYEYPKVYRIISKPNDVPFLGRKMNNPSTCVNKILIPYNSNKINQFDPENNIRFQSPSWKPNYFTKYMNDYGMNNVDRMFSPRFVPGAGRTKYPQNNYITAPNSQPLMQALVRPYRADYQNTKPALKQIMSEDNYNYNEQPLTLNDLIAGNRKFYNDPTVFDDKEMKIYALVRPYRADITNIKPTYQYYIPRRSAVDVDEDDDSIENNIDDEDSLAFNDLLDDTRRFYNGGDEIEDNEMKPYIRPGIMSYESYPNNKKNFRKFNGMISHKGKHGNIKIIGSGSTHVIQHPILDDTLNPSLRMPTHILLELKKFILDIVNKKQMNDMTPDLIGYIKSYYSVMIKHIENIFKTENILSSEINPLIINQLIQLKKDSQMRYTINNIPEPLINLILQLKEVIHNNIDISLEKKVLEIINNNNPSDLKSILLQLILKYGDKGIPSHIKNWLLTLPNGQELIEFLQKPGDINCQQVDYKMICTKSIKEDFPLNIQIELKNLINGIINDNRLNIISPILLEFIVKHPDITKLIETIFQKEMISNSKINPEIIIELIKLSQSNTHNENISKSLFDLILKLKGVENLEKSLLEFVKARNPSDLNSILLQFIMKYGDKGIPSHIQNWLSTLPKGQELIEFLQKPGVIDCQNDNNKILCTKEIDDDVPPNIQAELKNLINGIINDNRLNEIPSLLEFIIKHPDMHNLIETIFKQEKIPYSQINPKIILQLIQLIKDNEMNTPIKNIPQPLIDLILKVKGNNNLIKPVLEVISGQNPSDLNSVLLQVIKNSDEKSIPSHIKDWLLTLPNGQEIIHFLEKPGDIICNQDNTNKVTCTKKTQDEVPSNIKTELENLINDIIKIKKLNNLSPNLLEFIIKYPDIHKLIEIIFKNKNIPNSELTPKIILDLLQLIKDNHMKTPIKNIPQPLIDLILKVKGNNNLIKPVLEVISGQNPSDLNSVLLQLIKNSDEKYIPSHIKDWLLTLPNGQEIINFLEKPGDVICNQDNNNKVTCTKKTQDEVPSNIKTELENLINDIIKIKKINNLSPNLLEFIIKYPDIHKLIEIIFKNKNIPNSELTPKIILDLLQLIKDNQMNTPIKNIPQPLIYLILKLKGDNNLEKSVLENINSQNPSDLNSVLLQLIKKSGGKDIPSHIKNWLLTLPNGQEIINILEKPGDIICNEDNKNKVTCTKTIKDDVPSNIQTELKDLIDNIIKNKKMNNISPNLLEFIIKYPDMHKLIETIFRNENISNSEINPKIIFQLIQLIKDNNMNTPIKNIPQSLIDLILKLKEVNNLEKLVLENINSQNPIDLNSVLLQLVKKFGGKDIPSHIKEWLLIQPNGKEIIDFLEKPGDIICDEDNNNKVTCTKKIKDDIPPNIQKELKNLINDIIKNEKMNIAPNLLEFIIKYPEMHKQLIDTIFHKEMISNTEINPEIIIQLLQLIRDNKMNTPIKNIPQPLIDLILRLKEVNKLEKPVLENINSQNPSHLNSVLLQLIKKSGGKDIPSHIKEWLLTLPNGKEIIYFLEQPGDIICDQDNKNKVTCTKKVKDYDVPPKVQTELKNLINDIIENKKMNQISPTLLKFIIKHPDLQNIIELIFKKEKISTSKVTPQSIIGLLSLIISDKNKEPIKKIPGDLEELVFNLRGNEELSKIILEWTKINKPKFMMEIFLKMIKENGGKIIPKFLHEWILLLPNGKQIIKYLQLPGDIECNQTSDGNFRCIKTFVSTPSIEIDDSFLEDPQKDPQKELKNFIFAIHDKNKLIDISPTLLEFIKKSSDLQKIILEIYQKNNISTDHINSHMIEQLLKLAIKIKTNESITEVPPAVLRLVTNLTGAEKFATTLLNWITTNHHSDMMQIFLQIIKENGGKVIPQNLRTWLLSLSDGEKIIEYLQLPGTIECKQKTGSHVQCTKILI